jgi:hypothetical protein
MRWPVWLTAGAILQILGLRSGLPLTGWMRRYILRGAVGSSVVGAGLCWLVWHWLFDSGGIDVWDLVTVATGAAVGLLGWRRRR